MSIINQETGSLVGILLIMFYSLMVFCEMPFSVIWFLPVVFCFITTIASLDSPSQEAKHYKTVKKNNDQNQHKQHPRVNSNIEALGLKMQSIAINVDPSWNS